MFKFLIKIDIFRINMINKLIKMHKQQNQSDHLQQKQASNQSQQSQYDKIRSKYSKQIKQPSMIAQLLNKWIHSAHQKDFLSIYNQTIQKLRKSQSKVLDENQTKQETSIVNNKQIQEAILESIKIVIKRQEGLQNSQVLINGEFKQEEVNALIQDVKKIFEVALANQPAKQSSKKKKENSVTTTKQAEKTKQNYETVTKPYKKENPVPKSQLNQAKQQSKSKHTSGHAQNQNQEKQKQKQKQKEKEKQKQKQEQKQKIIAQPVVKKVSKSNSLFVEKEKPIAESDIFKGQNISALLKKVNKIAGNKQISNDNLNHEQMKGNVQPKNEQESPKTYQPDQIQHEFQNNEKKVKRSRKQSRNHSQVIQNENEHIQIQQNPEIQKQDEEQQNRSHVEEQQQPEKRKINDFYLPPAFKLSNERPKKQKSPIDSILTNPYIKKAFSQICKQSYIGGGKTFDQIAQSSDIMTINKWMVFCKQFDFLQKLKKKVLMDIFHQVTQFKSQMNKDQFLNALIIIQEKLRVDQKDFVRSNMGLDSEISFRQKVAAFKVNYAGAKYNCFEEASRLPIDRFYQRKKQQKYLKDRLKQRQHILHQGKFKQQIDFQLVERKKLRSLKKEKSIGYSEGLSTNYQRPSLNLRSKISSKQDSMSPYSKYLQNRSMATEGEQKSNNSKLTDSRMKQAIKKMKPMTYSSIFNQKIVGNKSFGPSDKVQKNSDASTNQGLTSRKQASNISKIIKNSDQIKSNVKKQSTPIPSGILLDTNSNVKKMQKKPQRHWEQTVREWQTKFKRSNSEQSDQILKQHLQNQKSSLKAMPQPIQLSRIINAYKQDEQWLQRDQNQWQRQTQMEITKNIEKFN